MAGASPEPHRATAPFPTRVLRRLDEPVMGLAALVALATSFGPLVFETSAGTHRLLDGLEWVILGLFAVEFALQGAAAPNRAAWLKSPWRLIDIACIAGPLVSLLPSAPEHLRGAMALRLLRLGRGLAFGAKAGSVALRSAGGDVRRLDPTIRVQMVKPAQPLAPVESSWPQFVEWLRRPDAAWFHASQPGPTQFADLTACGAVTPAALAQFQDPRSHARVQNVGGRASVVLTMPMVDAESPEPSARNRILLVVGPTGVWTASTLPLDLPDHLAQFEAHLQVPANSFRARVAGGLLSLVRERLDSAAIRLEEHASVLEEADLTDGTAFLRRAFQTQRRIGRTSIDVSRLEVAVRAFTDGTVALADADAETQRFFTTLQSEVDALGDRLQTINETVKSLIDFHINVSSFQMNKFMKLLAIVSFLGLIPAVVGGLLGMNVLGNPWHVTLGQVAFGVTIAMALSLYVFAIKGWLR